MKPSGAIPFWLEGKKAKAVWAGFAKRERMGWWKQQGGIPVDIPAERFSERSRTTAMRVWADMPKGEVIRGLYFPAENVVKVVTRPVTDAELKYFGHDRICVTEPPIFSAELIPVDPPPKSNRPEQTELFE